MLVSALPVTVTAVQPVIPERLALMVGVPTETAVISPPTTVALARLEDQVAWEVMSCVVWSLYLPVAYTCSVVPAARVGGATGVVEPCVPVSVMLVSALPVTVTAVQPVIPERLALMVGVPTETAVISPPTTVALAPLEDQVAWEVMSCVLWSLYLPVAYTCSVVPAARVGGATGVVEPCVPVSVMLVSAFLTVRVKVFCTEPRLVPATAAVIVVVPVPV